MQLLACLLPLGLQERVTQDDIEDRTCPTRLLTAVAWHNSHARSPPVELHVWLTPSCWTGCTWESGRSAESSLRLHRQHLIRLKHALQLNALEC